MNKRSFLDILSYIMLAAIFFMVSFFIHKAISEPLPIPPFVPVVVQEVKPSLALYSNPAVEKLLPAGTKLEQLQQDPLIIKITNKDGSSEYAAVGKAVGHQSEISVLVIINIEHKITNISIVEQHDTPNVFEKIYKNNFLSQFVGKNIDAGFVLGKGIDAISGATNSSYGITKAVANAAEVLKTGKIKE